MLIQSVNLKYTSGSTFWNIPPRRRLDVLHSSRDIFRGGGGGGGWGVFGGGLVMGRGRSVIIIFIPKSWMLRLPQVTS